MPKFPKKPNIDKIFSAHKSGSGPLPVAEELFNAAEYFFGLREIERDVLYTLLHFNPLSPPPAYLLAERLEKPEADINSALISLKEKGFIDFGEGGMDFAGTYKALLKPMNFER